MTLPGNTAHRRNLLWRAALVHRLSGILLALFLPLHFLALGLAIESEARLQTFIAWSAAPLVKFAEMGLVFLLAVHLMGGIRVLVVENLPWRGGQKQKALIVFAVAIAAALIFILSAVYQ